MSKELAKTYDPKGLEDRLYQKWMDKNYFHAEVDETKKPFTIVIPPPNITGQLHMGHALDNTMQDILIRYKRMQGYNALWQPGTDHASIATEVRIIEKLKEEGTSKEELLYHGRGLQQGGHRGVLQDARKRLDLQGQQDHQLVSGMQYVHFRCGSGVRGAGRSFLAYQVSAGGRERCAQ